VVVQGFWVPGGDDDGEGKFVDMEDRLRQEVDANDVGDEEMLGDEEGRPRQEVDDEDGGDEETFGGEDDRLRQESGDGPVFVGGEGFEGGNGSVLFARIRRGAPVACPVVPEDGI
jgi:hypothetical protein